jgi:Domain of unknown function (DUF1918)
MGWFDLQAVVFAHPVELTHPHTLNPARGWAPDGNGLASPWSLGSADRIRAGNTVKHHLRERAPKGGSEMDAHVGDSIVLESERVGQPAHSGVVEEVLQGQQPRYRVRWEDGHESIVAPAAGAARIEPKK